MVELTKPSADAADSWGPPDTFDQFVIERVLGRGGMGHVYPRAGYRARAARRHQVHLRRRSFVRRAGGAFLVEARAIARLSHRNVVGVYRIGDVENRPYIAYEFVDGESLDRIAKPLSWETTLRLGVGLAAGLAAAHAEGILHRDIKPGNAVLSDRGEIKLLDFGSPSSPAPPTRSTTPPLR